jgi:hypothetical protein
MNQKSAKGFHKRPEQRNPYLLVEYWKEGERPFNWFAEWTHLSLEISNVQVAISHEYLDRTFSGDGKTVSLNEVDENMVHKEIPDSQKQAFLEYLIRLFNESFTRPNVDQTLFISGILRLRMREASGSLDQANRKRKNAPQQKVISRYVPTTK